MNEHARTSSRPSTRAAEGVPRWRWTTAELLRLVELGAFSDTDKFELIGGEIVPMSPKGRRHELVADELAQFRLTCIPAEVRISVERQFNPDEATYTDPDLVVRPADTKIYDLKGPEALLVVEVADSSWAKDTGLKARTYASFGVREYWVINALDLSTRVHLEPGPGGYARVDDHAAETSLEPTLVPTLAVTLANLDLD